MGKNRKLMFGKSVLLAFAGTVVAIVLLVFVTGLSSHRSILDNSLISLSILSILFLVFLTTRLYNGLNVYDNLSHKLQLSWRKSKKGTSNDFIDVPSFDVPDVGDGFEGIIVGVVLWIVITLVLVILMFVFSTVIWATSVLLVIAIYWTMIRGLKLVFSKSEECEGDFLKSLMFAIQYSFLFVGWIYGVIYLSTVM